MENLNFYILTGGPGSGKSTVLKLLSDMGYLTVEETGRNIIQKQIKSLGDAVPWNNVSRYARLMFLHAITDFEELVHVQKTCFFIIRKSFYFPHGKKFIRMIPNGSKTSKKLNAHIIP